MPETVRHKMTGQKWSSHGS